MKEKTLSATMVAAIDLAQDGGGKLVRLQGGFWTKPNAPRRRDGVPVEYFSAPTIQALVARNEAIYTEWKQGVRARFPIEMTLAPVEKLRSERK